MSFRRLLAVGKSVHGFNHDSGRFKMPEQRWLPDFGPSRFGAEHGKPVGGGDLADTKNGEGTSGNTAPSFEGANEVAGELSKSRWAWLSGKIRWPKLFSCQTEEASQTEHYVQSELSLETLTVQRNDLSETDFEFAVRDPQGGPERDAVRASALAASVAGLQEIGRAVRSLIQVDRV